MACARMATCRARFARGEQACVRCAEGRLDVGDVEDLDDGEDNLDEGETDDIDDDDNEEEEDEVGYTTQPNGTFGAIAHIIEINGHCVPGIRVILTFEDGEDEMYVFAVENEPGAIPGDVHADIDPVVDQYVKSYERLYDVLEERTGFVIRQK